MPKYAGRNEDSREPFGREASRAGAARRHLDIPGQAHQHEEAQQKIGQIDLPPVPLIAGATRLRVVIVVPALAARDDRHQYVVAAMIAGIVILIAEHMRQRVHAPGDVPDDDRANDDAPQPYAGAELNRRHDVAAYRERDQEADAIIDQGLRERDPHDMALDEAVEAVAQDIARITVVGALAAEISVLQKQPAHVRPEEVDQRAVRIGALVGTMVMHAMGRHPPRRRILDTPDGEKRKAMLEPERALEAAMGEQAMIAKVHPAGAIDIDTDKGEHGARCRIEPWNKRKKRQQVIGPDGGPISPIAPPLAGPKRKRQRGRGFDHAGHGGADAAMKRLFQKRPRAPQIP